MFRIPRIVHVEHRGSWRALRPSQLTRVATAAGQVAWRDAGRVIPAPWGIEPPGAEAPSWPWTPSTPTTPPAAFATETWALETWRLALDRLDLRPEVFRFRTATFNVVWAKAYAQGAKLTVHRGVPTAAWWPGGQGATTIDPARVASVALDRPLIFVHLGTQEPQRILIDGNHRATKAMESQTEVEFVVLPVSLTWRTLYPCDLRNRLRKIAERG